MTRQDREQQLFNLMRTNLAGLFQIYMQAFGTKSGASPQIGTFASQMIVEILDKEFPSDQQTIAV